MKRLLATIVVMGFVAAACSGETTPPEPTTTAVPASTSTSGPGATTTTAVTTSTTSTAPTTSTPSTTSTAPTTSTAAPIGFPLIALPTEADCALDAVPETGEATVLASGRLYGLGADGTTPRCLADGVATSDFVWGPRGDRIRIGNEVIRVDGAVTLPSASGYVWTAPTGSRVLAMTPDRLWKIGIADLAEIDITFLVESEAAAYHPAGEHVLAIGATDEEYGLWLATNQGSDPLRLAFDEDATISNPTWTWLGEPMFAANHSDRRWHIHTVELTPDGALDGPLIVEAPEPIDMLLPARHDPIMLAYRLGGQAGQYCVEGSRVAVKATDVPEPVASMTSTPVGWLSTERLLVLTYPNGCDSPADLWSFSAGFCPGAEYGVTPIISGIDAAAAREMSPSPPPPPDFTGIINPAPA